MKNSWRTRVVLLLVSVLAVWNCTTTQPDRVHVRSVSLGVVTRGLVDLYVCAERWRDVNLDGLIDAANDEYLGMQCNLAPGTTKAHRNLPWHYSLHVTLIRAGTTTEEVAVSHSGVIGSSVQPVEHPAIDDYISMTEYDADQPPVGDQNIPGTPIYLINGHTVSPGSPLYLNANGFNLGEPNCLGELGVSGAAPTFEFDIDSGDTVIVRMRKKPYSLMTADDEEFLPLNSDSEVQLSAVLTVSGVEVSTSPGSPTSTFDDGAGVTFSFTVQ